MPDDGDSDDPIRTLERLAAAHVRRGRPAMTRKAVESEHEPETVSNAVVQGVSTDKGLCCTFCWKSATEVKKLISNASGTARICDECVAVCSSILRDDAMAAKGLCCKNNAVVETEPTANLFGRLFSFQSEDFPDELNLPKDIPFRQPPHFAFPDRVQNLVPLNRPPASIERSQALAGIHPPLNRSMVLFHNIV